MAQFDDPLPSLAFPCELDSLAIQCDNSDPLPLTIRVGGQNGTIILQTTLYPDSADMVFLNDLAPLLQDNLPPRSISQVYFELDDHAEGVLVIPSHAEMELPASSFCEDNFLTLLDGAKTTYIGGDEYLSYYSTTSVTPTISCLWVNPDTGETRQAAGIVAMITHHGANLYTIRFVPGNFVCPAEGFILHSFKVSAGEREQDYILHTPIDCDPFSLQFYNNFGQLETFHYFGTKEKELKPTRSTASFSGKTRNYKVDAVPTWKCHTGVLPDSVQPLFADLCAAKRVWREDNTREVTITENELKISNDRYEVQTDTVTFRETARTTLHRKQNVPQEVFDDTFDNTFE